MRCPRALSLSLGLGLCLSLSAAAPARGGDGRGDSPDCDPLVPQYCMLPFPNNFWLDEETGRVALGETTFPLDRSGKPIDPDAGGWNDLQGFSTFPSINAYFPGMGDEHIEDCARLWDMDVSLDTEQSPTLLLDAETGDVVAHWVEMDHATDSDSEVRPVHPRAMLMWPATKLVDNHRYIVAIRRTGSMAGLPRSEAFEALLTGVETGDDRIESRRQHYETDIFPAIASLGFTRDTLLLAWDFKTNTADSITRRMVTARDDAMARLPADGPEYKIEKIQYNTSEDVYAQVNGVFRMPMYLNTHLPKPDARLITDGMGNAEFQGWAWFRFEVIVPWSLVENGTSGRVVGFGHGLFENEDEVEADYNTHDANIYGWVLAASNWIGLSTQDVPAAVSLVLDDLTDFDYIPSRATQSMVNALGLMRMMRGRFAKDPAMIVGNVPVIDPDLPPAYMGNSEGGIFGAVYMAVTQDVEYGLLGVPGGPYGLLLPRSSDFAIEFDMLKLRYPDPVDTINLMNAIQMLWDRSEPSGYMDRINNVDKLLPNTPLHQVIVHNAIGDSQVTWLGAQALARGVNAFMFESNIPCGNETFFGFDFVDDDAAVSGRSAIQTFDYDAPTPPFVNQPPEKDTDTHHDPRKDSRAQDMMNHFFAVARGEIINTCDGACDNVCDGPCHDN